MCASLLTACAGLQLPSLGYAFGSLGCTINTVSFCCSYAMMAAHLLRSRNPPADHLASSADHPASREAPASPAAAPDASAAEANAPAVAKPPGDVSDISDDPRCVFVTVGCINNISGGYIFERLLLEVRAA